MPAPTTTYVSLSRARATPFSPPDPPLSHSPGEYSYPFRRDTGLKNRGTFQAATSNVIPRLSPSPINIRAMVESESTAFLFAPHARISCVRNLGYFRRVCKGQRNVCPGINSCGMYSRRNSAGREDTRRHTYAKINYEINKIE